MKSRAVCRLPAKFILSAFFYLAAFYLTIFHWRAAPACASVANVGDGCPGRLRKAQGLPGRLSRTARDRKHKTVPPISTPAGVNSTRALSGGGAVGEGAALKPRGNGPRSFGHGWSLVFRGLGKRKFSRFCIDFVSSLAGNRRQIPPALVTAGPRPRQGKHKRTASESGGPPLFKTV